MTESKVNVFLMTLLVFLDMEPFFVWSTVSPFGYRFYTGVILIATLFMVYRVLIKKRIVAGKVPEIADCRQVNLSLLLASSLVVILLFYEMFFSGVVTETQQPFNMAMLCIHLGLMFFSLQDNITLRRVFILSKRLFAISLIPAILVFFLMQIGVALPFVKLAADAGKDMTGQSYELYMGFATMLRNQGGLLNRLCGMYREPGFVGTIGVLFLFGDKLTFRKWENVIILIAGACTFSLAFVLLFVLGIMLHLVGKLKTRGGFVTGVSLILAIVIGYFSFMSLPLNENSMLGELQGRMEITDEGLAGDNRFGSSEWAVDAYDQFLKSDLKTRLFGYGRDPRVIPGTEISIWQTVHSYKEFVFGFGFLGLILMIASIVFAYWAKFCKVPKASRWQIFVLVLIFMISIYQRYMIINFHYYCVLFGGAANLALMEYEKQEARMLDQGTHRRVVVRW